MIQWLVNTIFKEYIDNLVDRRFRENTYERIRAVRTQELRSRAAAIRATLDSQTQKEHTLKSNTTGLLPSSNIRRENLEPELSPKAAETLKKPMGADLLKAKLMGIKK